MDDSITRKEFGIEPRPLEQTFADTIRWMVEAGHLSPRLAGKLAENGLRPVIKNRFSKERCDEKLIW